MTMTMIPRFDFGWTTTMKMQLELRRPRRDLALLSIPYNSSKPMGGNAATTTTTTTTTTSLLTMLIIIHGNWMRSIAPLFLYSHFMVLLLHDQLRGWQRPS